MLTYDYFCERCKCTEERRVDSAVVDVQHCVNCDCRMVRLMPAPFGVVRGPAVPKGR